MPTVSVTTIAPVPPSATAIAPAPAGRILVSIASVDAVTSAGQGPGEVAGQPAIAVTLQMRNATPRPLDLGQVSVTAASGPAGAPASPSDGPPASPFTGTLRPGAAATGTYVFRVPQDQRGQVQLAVSYLAGQPVVLFKGPIG